MFVVRNRFIQASSLMKTTEPKYEYHLYTWGGFYNEEYFKIHQKPQGDFWFDTYEERQQFIDELRAIEDKLNARHLSMTLSEGYCCRTSTILHRVVEWEGKRYYSKCDMGINYPFSAAKHCLEYKWTCGFNDYPLGEDFDYDTNKPKVIQEWITGAEREFEFERQSQYKPNTITPKEEQNNALSNGVVNTRFFFVCTMGKSPNGTIWFNNFEIQTTYGHPTFKRCIELSNDRFPDMREVTLISISEISPEDRKVFLSEQ